MTLLFVAAPGIAGRSPGSVSVGTSSSSPRKKKLNSRSFLQWSGLGQAQQRRGCSAREAQPSCLAAPLPCVGPGVKDCAVPGLQLFSFPP